MSTKYGVDRYNPPEGYVVGQKEDDDEETRKLIERLLGRPLTLEQAQELIQQNAAAARTTGRERARTNIGATQGPAAAQRVADAVRDAEGKDIAEEGKRRAQAGNYGTFDRTFKGLSDQEIAAGDRKRKEIKLANLQRLLGDKEAKLRKGNTGTMQIGTPGAMIVNKTDRPLTAEEEWALKDRIEEIKRKIAALTAGVEE